MFDPHRRLFCCNPEKNPPTREPVHPPPLPSYNESLKPYTSDLTYYLHY